MTTLFAWSNDKNKKKHLCHIYGLICAVKLTFVSRQVYLDWSDDASSQWLPSANHHVDHTLTAQHRFDDLLPIFIGQVHIVYFQQPVIHPEETRNSVTVQFNKLDTNK